MREERKIRVHPLQRSAGRTAHPCRPRPRHHPRLECGWGMLARSLPVPSPSLGPCQTTPAAALRPSPFMVALGGGAGMVPAGHSDADQRAASILNMAAATSRMLMLGLFNSIDLRFLAALHPSPFCLAPCLGATMETYRPRLVGEYWLQYFVVVFPCRRSAVPPWPALP